MLILLANFSLVVSFKSIFDTVLLLLPDLLLVKLKVDGYAQSYVYALHVRLAQVLSDAVHDGLLARSPASRREARRPT